MARRRSIRSSVIILTITSTLVVALGFLVIWFFAQAASLRRAVDEKTVTVADRLQQTLASPFWNFDIDQMTAIAHSELGDLDISRIDIVEASGKPVLSVGTGPVRVPLSSGLPGSVIERKITYHDLSLGSVRITASGLASTRDFALRMGEQALVIFLVGIVLALVLFFAIDRGISSRIAVLRAEIGSFSAADFGRRASDGREDEIGDLAATFNMMADTIERYGRDLEGIVESRTRELQARNEELAAAKVDVENRLVELRRTQNQLIESAKFAEIGRILAQIVHDLNSPIAAIRATLDEFETTDMAGFAALPALCADLGERELSLVARLSEASESRPFNEDFRSRRKRREIARALVEASDVDDTEGRLADRIFELGLDRSPALVDEALREPLGPRLVEIAEILNQARVVDGTLDAATRRATSVLASLRNYLHSERSSEEFSTFSVDAEIDGILALFAHRLRNGIMLERETDARCEIAGRRDQLAQVWMNLIDNAIQAMGGEGRLSVRARSDGGVVAVEIGDTGPGIPPDAAPMIFEPFFTTKKKGEGTGLGLAIAKRVVEDHGGRITWSSQPGRTLFRVELPARLAAS